MGKYFFSTGKMKFARLSPIRTLFQLDFRRLLGFKKGKNANFL